LSLPGPHAETRLEFHILGPLEVLRNGESVVLGPRKQRALLTLLLLHADRVVSTDRLIDELWAGRPPEGAAKTLRSYVSRLRRLVGDGVVMNRPPGYVLELGSGDLDARTFEDLLGQGRDALARGNGPEAAAHLRAALALWRGNALADLADEPFARIEASRLEELRLEAVEERVEADLDAGRHGELIAELEALVAEQPLRERLWAQLMTALYRSGRQADALAAYREARNLLAERLGLEAGQQLRELEQKILRQELDTVPAAAPPHNLPAQLTSFIGREREQEELARLLLTVPLVTLTGVGGCGKTRLALETALQALPSFRDGVVLVELAGLTKPELVPHAVAAALDTRERSERPVAEVLSDRLRAQALLLILDNCEHLLDACAALVRRVLNTCPKLRVVATSREPLALNGEHVFRVPPLSVGDDAVRLFLERAAAAGAKLDRSPELIATVTAICRELDGLPLAVELAAARAHVLSVEEIAARLDDRFRFLRYWRRSPEPRHQTLGTTMAWSYDLLLPDEQRLLRGLSVFAGGFTLEAAAGVCLEGDEDEALSLLTRLIDSSLVVAEQVDGTTRYRMLETVRRYGGEQVDEAGEEHEARRRHAAYFLDLAEREWEGVDAPTGGSWWTELGEVDNLRAALGCYIDSGVTNESLRLVCALTWFWERTDRIAEGRIWCERALALNGDVDPKCRAQALYAAGCLGWLANDFATAAELLEESRDVFERLGETLWLARVLDRRADLHFSAGELEAARAAFEASLRNFEELSRPSGVAAARHGLGQAFRDLGDMETARSHLVTAADMYRALKDEVTLASTLHSTGDLDLDVGELDAAAEHYKESLALAGELGMSQRMIAYCLAGLAAVAAANGDAERAGRLWGALERREDAMGVTLHSAERNRYERLVESVAGRDDFASEAAAGRLMTLEQATAYASRPATYHSSNGSKMS
jgi:predicted ATPase/DNA-binding SARP family transcriptional activator